MKRIAFAFVAACIAVPALAEDVGVGVRVGPVGVGVGTTGSSSNTVVREREVIRERREPRDKTVIIKKDRDPDVTVEKKTIIRRD